MKNKLISHQITLWLDGAQRRAKALALVKEAENLIPQAENLLQQIQSSDLIQSSLKNQLKYMYFITTTKQIYL